MHSREAEQFVVGAILLRNDLIDDVVEIVNSEDFADMAHSKLFTAAIEMHNAGHPCDVLTLSEHLDKRGELESIGGLAYIGTIASNTPSHANALSYARIVSNKARERRTLAALNESMGIVQAKGDTDDKLQEVAVRIASATELRDRGDGPKQISESLPSWMASLDERLERKGGITGLATAWQDLDSMTRGLQPADLIIIAGRPSMGKTTIAQNIAEHVAINGAPVLFFSLEMPTEQIIDRAASSIGRINNGKIKTADMDDGEWARVTHAVGRLNASRLIIDDTSSLTPMELRSRARKVKRKHGLELIVVDYLQLMHVPGYKNDKVHEIEEISRNLKALAKELRVPVIALSQLNRSVDNRQDKRPVMSDLRESGAIEQDADVIMFIYRADQYRSTEEDKDNVAELIIRKQRNGPTGTVKLVSDLAHCRFLSYDGRTQYDDQVKPMSSYRGFEDE